MAVFAQQVLNGLTVGSLFALVAVGLSLIYGAFRIIHIAHGSVYMLGGMLSYSLLAQLRVPPLAAAGLTTVACAALGILLERFAYRPLRDANIIVTLISSLGLLLALDNLARILWGPVPQAYPAFVPVRVYTVGRLVLSNIQVVIILIAALLMAGVQLALRRTKFGLAALAAVQNARGARLVGIDIDRLATVIFAVGSGLAGVAGILVGLHVTTVDPSMGDLFGLKAFVAVVLGGLGSVVGTIVGAYIIGVAEALTAAYLSAGLRDVITFAILVLVLMVRPSGLFGRRVDRA